MNCLLQVGKFSSFSGLGYNLKKTTIMTTHTPTETDQFALKLAGANKLRFTEAATYLGVRMGRKIGTVEVFAEAKKNSILEFKPTDDRSST